jgi:hypothetical protein
MNRSNKILKLVNPSVDTVREDAVTGPRDEDVASYVFSSLVGEKVFSGVKVKVDRQPMRGAPLDITVDYPFRGKTYKIQARIPTQAFRMISIT